MTPGDLRPPRLPTDSALTISRTRASGWSSGALEPKTLSLLPEILTTSSISCWRARYACTRSMVTSRRRRPHKDVGVFGKLSLVEGRWQDVFAEAVTDVLVAGVQKAALTEVIKRRPEFAMKLFSSFSERLRQSDEVIESLLHREVSARLATLLLNLAERFGEGDESGTNLGVRLTHQELANMIASTREADSKVMGEFQREGAIEVHNRKIVLVNKEAIAKRASGPSGLSVDGQLPI